MFEHIPAVFQHSACRFLTYNQTHVTRTRDPQNSNDARYRLYSNKTTECDLQYAINENYEKQPCAARTLRPIQKQHYAVATLCCRDAKTFRLSLTDQPSRSSWCLE